MSKGNANKLLRNAKVSLAKHSPDILIGLGIAGMITTTILAVKMTPKALELIADAEYENDRRLTPVEKVKTCWKCYIPATISGVASISCIIGARSVSAKRSAALATAYSLSESALREYKAKVIETIGEKKEQVVRDGIAEDRLKENPVSKNNVIITGKDPTLCLDYFSGRYFKSDIETIRKAVNNLNYAMLSEMYVSVNDFYDELGLEHTKQGDDLGWNIDSGKIEIEFDYGPAEDGTPCLVLNYSIAPRYDYYKFN